MKSAAASQGKAGGKAAAEGGPSSADDQGKEESQGQAAGDNVSGASASCAFEDDLADYVSKYGLSLRHVVGEIRRHDFSAAKAALIPSVPGAHKGADMLRYGHTKLRRLLSREPLPAEFAAGGGGSSDDGIVAQITSAGALTRQWIDDEFAVSLAAHAPARGQQQQQQQQQQTQHAQRPALKLVWPTVDDIRNSFEGYAAGGA